MLEPLVDAWEEEPSSDIKMHLLTAAVKLFFKRPPEMQVCASIHQTSSVPRFVWSITTFSFIFP